jgi:hypothetical protein
VPVVAGALVTSGAGVGAAAESRTAPLDRAWVASTAPSSSAGVALPAPASGDGDGEAVRAAVVALVDPPPGQDRRASVATTMELVDGGGDVVGEVELTVVRGTTVRLPVTELVRRADLAGSADVAAVRVRTDGAPVALGATLTATSADGDLVSVLTATPDQAPRAALRVDVR